MVTEGPAPAAPSRGRRNRTRRSNRERSAGHEEADDHAEEGDAFHERGGEDHVHEDAAAHFGLTGGRFAGDGADAADAETGTDDREAGRDALADAGAPVDGLTVGGEGGLEDEEGDEEGEEVTGLDVGVI